MNQTGSNISTQESDNWVKSVSLLQQQIGNKLLAIQFVHAAEGEEISHHLAEISYICAMISTRLVPMFLKSEGIELGDVVLDIHTELQEMKDAILSMEEDLIKLMNQLNP